jgi:hypothetical protein
VNAVNQILEMSTKETMEMAKKLVKVALQENLGAEAGKGANVDTSA